MTMNTEKHAVARKTTFVSIGVNVALVGLQLAVGFVAHSQALIADGIHSLSDLLADGVVLIANKQSSAAPDDDHNYGHGRYETVASFFLGSILVIVGAGMLWQATVRLTHLNQLPDVHINALYVAMVVIVAKEGLFRYMLREAERVRSSLLVANAWHARSDAASSLVVGLGIIGSLLGFKVMDPIAASIVGFIVVRMGWGFAWNALQDLSDRALDTPAALSMKAVLAGTPGVRDVHAFKTRKMGDNALVDAHLRVDPHITVSEGHFIAETARARLKRDPRVLDAMIHIDPEDDHRMQDSQPPLPTRDTLKEQATQTFATLGVHVMAIHLHYLDGKVNMDVVVAETSDSADFADIDLDEIATRLNVGRIQLLLALVRA